jgi:aryl-alcohol dehydrogenase-like predicted oxidoreductase
MCAMASNGGASTRRRFLAGAAGTAVVAALDPLAVAGEPAAAPLPRRPFGKTGEHVTLFGLGCFPLGSIRKERDGVEVALRALDAGCNYLDTAPSYSRGVSERRVGLALKERKPKGVLLATKTHTRTKAAAWRDIEGSLKRLGVDRIDVLQIHAIKGEDDLAKALDERAGPLAALLEAREQKLIRFIGVTGHYDPAVMRMAFERWPFASILFPLNCVDPHYRTKAAGGKPPERLSFLDQTLPAACENGLARVAMKVFSSGRLPKNGVEARACLRFTYGLDVSTAIVGCASKAEVDLAVEVARENKPLTEPARKALLASTEHLQGKTTEWYKRT